MINERFFKSSRMMVPWLYGGTTALFLCTISAWGWPHWWCMIIYERCPLTWYSSTQLVICGFLLLPLWFIGTIVHTDTKIRQRNRFVLFLALAFFFLSIDETFQIHERLREGVFKPHGIGTHLPGIAPGDFLFLIYAAAGIAIAWLLRPILKLDRRATLFFVAGMSLAAVSVGIDITHCSVASRDLFDASAAWQVTEEICETASQSCMMIAFTLLNIRLIEDLTACTARI